MLESMIRLDIIVVIGLKLRGCPRSVWVVT